MNIKDFSVESETYCIGCFVKDATLLESHRLNSDHFLDSRNRTIFEKMYEMINDELKIDPAALSLELGAAMMEHITWAMRLAQSVHNFRHHEELVIEAWKKREARNVLATTENDEFTSADIPFIIRDLEKIDEQGISSEEKTKDVIADLMQVPYVRDETLIGYKTGFGVFDKITGGLRRKELSYWCARPSVGKTAFSVELFKRFIGRKVAVLYFSYEMAKKGIIIRLMCNMTGIDSRDVPEATTTFTPQMADDWQAAGRVLQEQVFDIVETVGNTNYMRTCIRKFKKANPDVDFIVMVDYLTKIKPVNKYQGNGHAEVTEISAELKEIAKDFDTHVACLAQLSRGVEGRQDKRPMMSDIRESGSVEQDGDIIGMLFRPDYQTEEDHKPTQRLEVNVIKNRNGAVGLCNFEMHKPTGKLKEVV